MTATKYVLDMGQVSAWYEAGDSIRAIGRRTGIPYKTIQRHMVTAGIERRPPGPVIPIHQVQARRSTAAERQQARALLEDGSLLEDVADRLGRSPDSIRRWTRPVMRERRQMDVRAEEQVREWHARGLRGTQIDDRLGWYRGKALLIQKKLGLDGRLPAPASAGELAQLYGSLGSVGAVAAHLGASYKRTGTALKAAGIHLVSGGRRHHLPLDDHLDAIRRARLVQRVPVGELASRYGVSYGYMNGYLNSRGIRGFRRRTAAEHREMLGLRAAGMSYARIGRRFGVSGQTVAQHVKNPGNRPRLR
jgi:transposase